MEYKPDDIGPANHLVVVVRNIASNITNPVDLQAGPKGVNYKEQIQWRDAATGKLLADSDYFSPMSVGFEVWPGLSGLIYEGLNYGHIMALEILPASSNSTSSKSPSTSASPFSSPNSISNNSKTAG